MNTVVHFTTSKKKKQERKNVRKAKYRKRHKRKGEKGLRCFPESAKRAETSNFASHRNKQNSGTEHAELKKKKERERES